jgi:signal transduction histidine kinase
MAWGDGASKPRFDKWRRTAADRYLGWLGVHTSLAFKLAVPILMTTIVLVSVLGAIVVNTVQREIDSAYAQQAQEAAFGVEAMFAQHPNDVAQINDYLSRLVKSRHDLVAIRILNLDDTGTVIASSTPSEIGTGGFADKAELRAIWGGYAYTDPNTGPYLTTVQPLILGDAVFGAVFIQSSKSAQVAATRSITGTIAIVGTIAVVIDSVFVLSALYLGILRRTRRVQRAVEAVGRGDTSIRLPEGQEPPGRDEIVNLARSVDKMIATLDERQRGDTLVRRLSQLALQGAPTAEVVNQALVATREALGLDSCIFASISDDGSMAGWQDGSTGEHSGVTLPIWIFALTRVAVEARRAILTDRLGKESRFAEAPGTSTAAQALIVPLPRTSLAGQAIVAIAHRGESISESGLAVLDSIAATIAESLHMHAAENARAESAVKSKVMATVSHEMRNPLNSILGFTGLVLGAAPESLTDKQRRQLTFVQSSANSMLQLVNNYLDLAKVKAGSVALQFERVKIATLIADVAGGMQPIADAKSVVIKTSVSPEAEARLDPIRTRQVLTNLMSNAVKFTPSGGLVCVRARVAEGHCRIAVSDTGVGVTKDQQHLLFTEFSKIDAGSMGSAKGTGLGLALTKAFVTAMGGTMKVYSRRGRGSTFVVSLPSEAAPAQRSSAA